MAIEDRRARITPKSSSSIEQLLGPDSEDNVLQPLVRAGGLIFPYTPSVTVQYVSNYNPMSFSETNYSYKSWTNSDVSDITVVGLFTASNIQEARYMLAAIHFLKGATKGGFGLNDKLRGVSPAVYHFNYLGEYQFKNVPVVISNVTLDYSKDDDYVPVMVAGNDTKDYVPASMEVTAILSPQYNTQVVRDKFDIKKFREGGYLDDTGDGFL